MTKSELTSEGIKLLRKMSECVYPHLPELIYKEYERLDEEVWQIIINLKCSKKEESENES